MRRWYPQMSCGVLVALALGCTEPNPDFVGRRLDARAESRDAGAGLDAAMGGVVDAPPAPSDGASSRLDQDGPDAVDLSPGAAGLRMGLVALWDCDQAGQARLTDSSGNGNDGALSGLDPASSWVAGRRGSALTIPDTPGGVLVEPRPSIDGLQRLTLAAWVKRTANPDGRHTSVISRHFENSSRELYNLAFNNNALVLYLFSQPPAAVISVASTTLAPLGQWIHVAFTYDGQIARVYQAGVQVAQLAYTGVFPSSPNQLVIGNNSNARVLSQPLIGQLDDVAVYNRALSAAEIAALAGGAVP